MPWPVYSERFLYSIRLDGWKEYKVPDKMRAIVTMLSVVNTGEGTGAVQVLGHGVMVYYATFPASIVNLQVPMNVVVYQGERIQIATQGPGIQVSVHGKLLADNTGRDGPPDAFDAMPAEQLVELELPPAGEG